MKFTSILSSKGQITLPKTVREILKVSTHDKIDFILNGEGSFIITKNNKEPNNIPTNLIHQLLNGNNIVAISGQTATGKTQFVQSFLLSHFSDKKVVIVEPSDEYFNYFNETDIHFIYKHYNELNLEDILKKEPQIVVFEEAQLLQDLSSIHTLCDKGIIVFVVKHVFSEADKSVLSDYLSVSMNNNKSGVKKIEKVTHTQFESSETVLYLS